MDVISPLFRNRPIDEKIAHARAGIETGKSIRGRSPLYSASAILANGTLNPG